MRALTIFAVTLLFAVGAATAQVPESVLQDIQRSHIEANVPGALVFDTFLHRDVAMYFQSVMGIKNPIVKVELLRKGPTQTGIAYPKYYAWVVVKEGPKEVAEGALRLAAIERTRFEVTTFLSKADIKSTPGAVAAVFPMPLVAGISERASR